MKITEQLMNGFLITDGAMGTYHDKKYRNENMIAEQENITNPDRIKEIHLEYLEAGASVLRTNTFAAVTDYFPDRRERLAVVREGYRIAKEAVEEYSGRAQAVSAEYRSDDQAFAKTGDREIYIAADIGTIFEHSGLENEELLQEYRDVIDVFLEEGASLFWFETQSDFYYLTELTKYVKQKNQDAVVFASFNFDKTGYTKSGVSVQRMMDVISAETSIDAYGFNCGLDAAHLTKLLAGQNFPNDKPFIACPNAGYPMQLRGVTTYADNPGYFTEQMKNLPSFGVNLIGGCCGTTPYHIRKLSEALQGVSLSDKHIDAKNAAAYKKSNSRVLEKLEKGEKPYVVELDPPFNLDYSKIMRGAELLKENGVDLLTLSDSPLARTRMDAALLGSMVQREVGIQVMPHITCRDRNVISLRGTMMGAHVSGLRHFLIVTGDPVNAYDKSMTSQVFDFNSIRFMHMVQEMNEDLMKEDPMVYGGALNYHGANVDAIAGRMKKKMEMGCSYFLTQPIYSDEDVERIRVLREMTGAKIMAGIMPLVSYKNAQFMANEMPGIHVPEEIINAYRPDMTREEAEAAAEEICVSIAAKLSDVCDGYYFMVPFYRVPLINRIIQKIRTEVEGE